MVDFEKAMASLAVLDENARASKMDALKRVCVCDDCPTYTECARQIGECLFCLEGKSPSCIMTSVDCICPSCPMTRAYGLSHNYFCTRGGEADLKKAE